MQKPAEACADAYRTCPRFEPGEASSLRSRSGRGRQDHDAAECQFSSPVPSSVISSRASAGLIILCRSKIGFCVVSCVFLEFTRLGRTR
jgi:hypothetical protein